MPETEAMKLRKCARCKKSDVVKGSYVLTLHKHPVESSCLLKYLSFELWTCPPQQRLTLVTDVRTDFWKDVAFSVDGKTAAVLNTYGKSVCVFTFPDWNEIGTLQNGDRQFDSPMQICFNNDGNLLVAEYYAKRIVEVTMTGCHVRFIGTAVLECGPVTVVANAEVIVASDAIFVYVFNAITGALRTRVNRDGFKDSLCLSQNMIFIIAIECSSKQVTRVLTLDGKYVMSLGKPVDKIDCVAVTPDNNVIVAMENCLTIYSLATRSRIGEIRTPVGTCARPMKIAFNHSKMFVVDVLGLHMFE